MSKALLPLIEEDSNFEEVSPWAGVCPEVKAACGQMKAMRSTLVKPFFRPPLPQ